MSRDLLTLRDRKAKPLTREEAYRSDQLFNEYCSRPQHRTRLTATLIASLRAAANSVARHGIPPQYNQRLGYRTAKRRRKKAIALAIYGNPLATCPEDAV